MKLIGLTGSIATGKSTASRMCRELGLPVHDADETVHELLGPRGVAVSEILSVFNEVGSLSGGIDRMKLGNIIFHEPVKRQLVETILHPLVLESRRQFLQACQQKKVSRVVLDIPLLFETGGDVECDYIIVVWAPDWLQRMRALKRTGMTIDKLDGILAHQMPQPLKRRLANLLLPSSLGRGEMHRRLHKWLRMTK